VALDRFLTIDENNWVTRSANFFFALTNGDWAHTFQREHPGVTTMWAGGVGILARFADYREQGASEVSDREYRQILQRAGHSVTDLVAAGRFFVVLAVTGALLLSYCFARRIFGTLPAFVGFLLIALDPFHTAHSRLLHLDGLLSSFLLLAVLAFLSFLDRRRASDLVISGIASGLAWLTKSPGFFLIPIAALLTTIDLLRTFPRGGQVAASIWRSMWPFLLWGAIGLATFVALWPAMWVDPLGTMAGVLTPAVEYAEGGHSFPVFFAGTIYPDGEIEGFFHFFYPTTYLWRTTPIVLFGLLAAAVASIWRLKPLDQPRIRQAAGNLVLCVLVFGVLINLGTKKFDRYLLPAYAPLDLLAALGWVAAAYFVQAKRQEATLGRRWQIYLRQCSTPLLLGAAILVQTLGTVRTFPYYLSYYNPLLGGTSRAPEVMTIGWGEGLDEAARYLNTRISGDRLRVAAWYDVCFAPFFAGRTRPIPLQADLAPAQLERILEADYVVIYIHQWQRQMPQQLLEILAHQHPEHTVWINGLEYARIYRLRSP
jgi:hypothetical protein